MNEKTTQDEAPTMTPERWQRIKQIFDQVIEAETGSQEGPLTAACAGDDGLRAEVEKLLRGHEQASGFIEEPAVAKAAQILQISVEDALIGQQIGPYKVLREIGHGGMGQVYLAVRADDEYKKRVALKIIKRGMDTQEIIRRFRNERQILAGLDHPNIGKLLDGGTTEDGLPYFAMEYVAGKPITDYCDDRKLSTIERLKLFRHVCAAIQFAHQNLVVHRDIKPSNILVTEDGTPKLLDFGIAKVLNPELSGQTIDPTATALRLMTPEYASPEQVRGETITTASDVYSLGVVLYELLTGHRPYRVKSRLPHEILRIVCEEEPEKPSTAVSRTEEGTSRDGSKPITLTPESVSRTREGEPNKLRQKLRGDVDNIVLMAMRKEPQRRYTTVNQFSEDLRRYIDGLPVVASKDTVSYRAQKFVKRNRSAVVAAALIFLSLFGGIAVAWWQARIAQQRFNDVRQLANSLLFEVHDEIEKLPGSTSVRQLIVKRALEYLDRLAMQAGSDYS
ncbi:MAG: serine/threonine protein kinase [Blastocatellia bacterium]